jgi:hypothetical protein
LKKLELIGKGGFALVWLSCEIEDENKKYAVK